MNAGTATALGLAFRGEPPTVSVLADAIVE
jgi:hypothetical protein